ncbi:hypothetical protein [Ruminococcus flavefaciens]|uniref:hypothetical protein n=1 Tax=Ruminococcus flavefaciens TaxID=1265 RepID=UPI001564E4B7|nr:hypothetical protein [Ruminococcus flavefaciens]
MNSIYYFDIDDELFKEIKGNINIGINDILDGMSEKNVSEGEMSLSVKIVLLPELVTDVNGKQKRILIPHIEHKTSTKMTVKKSSKGKIFNEEYAEDGYLALDINGDGKEEYVTHRIYKVNKDGTFQTKGDANDLYDQAPEASPQFPNIAKGDVLAKYSGTKIGGLGGVVDYLKTPLGFFLCVLLPMIIFFIYQAVRVVLNLIAYNKEKALNQAKELIEASGLTEEQKKKLAEEYLAAQAANSGEDEKETPPKDAEAAVEETGEGE